MSAADELRQASEALRENPAQIEDPNIGLVVADWLDQCATRLDKGHHTGSRHSHRVARLIIGGAA